MNSAADALADELGIAVGDTDAESVGEEWL
jgi:hypothetical protein